MEQELVSGTIAAVVFENPENGYAVIKLDSDDGGLITVVGTIPAPAAGERLIVTGKWTAHATYGRQLEAEFLERLLPDSTAEIRAYLSSRAVGRWAENGRKDRRCLRHGQSENSRDRAGAADGDRRHLAQKALEIGASFRQQVAVRRLIEFLAGYRIPAQVAVRLYRVYGAQSLERVQEDPICWRSRSSAQASAQPISLRWSSALTATTPAASKRALFLSCATISQTDIPFSRRTSSLRQRPSC